MTSYEMNNRECKTVLTKVMNHRSAPPFLQPVDPLALSIPDYFEKITNPMDLGTVKTRLAQQHYQDADAFVNDVQLVFDNAKTYNPPGTVVHNMAQEVEDFFYREMQRFARTPRPPPAPAAPPVETAAVSDQPGSAEPPPEVEIIPQLTKRHMSQLLNVVKRTDEAAAAFNEPVDPVRLNIPDYFAKIIHPMDLGTIDNRLGKDMYEDTAAFVRDVRLVWNNAKEYNAPGSIVHNWANKLEDMFERELRKACSGPGANRGAPGQLIRQPSVGVGGGPPLVNAGLAQQAAAVEQAPQNEIVKTLCRPIVTNLRSHQHAKIFNAPVDLKTYKQYLDYVDRPMDLRTVLKNLEACKYATIDECQKDIEQIWENCIRYNGENSWPAGHAKELQKIANARLDQARHKMATGGIASPKPASGFKRKAPSTPKPSVVNFNEFCCVTPEMRQQLSVNASKLSASQLRSLMSVVKQCAPEAVHQTSSQSWEVDVDVLEIKSFIKVDTWVRRLLAQNPAAC